MRTPLVHLDPEQLGLVLAHPSQANVVEVITRLLDELRSLERLPDYYTFQRKLFGVIWEADTLRGEARRQTKRLADGKRVEDCFTHDWALEMLVHERIGRQLRSVGDALAWRLFGFDRRIIMALSRNDPAGPLTSKAGLEREIGEVQHTWQNDGVFALLHDLTNCLRIADVTKFTAEMPMLVEVKTNPNRLGGRQVSRMKQAIAVINDGAPLRVDDVDVELLRSHQQFHTRVRELPGAFERASSEGLFVLRLGTHWGPRPSTWCKSTASS